MVSRFRSGFVRIHACLPLTSVFFFFFFGGAARELRVHLSGSSVASGLFCFFWVRRASRGGRHLESAPLLAGCESRCAYLLQAFALARLGQCIAPDQSMYSWMSRELGPLGLDIAAQGQACVCRDGDGQGLRGSLSAVRVPGV